MKRIRVIALVIAFFGGVNGYSQVGNFFYGRGGYSLNSLVGSDAQNSRICPLYDFSFG